MNARERPVVGGAADLRRVLVISHVGDSKHKNGGTVYTRSLLDLIKRGHPDVEVELIFFTGQTPSLERRVRQLRSLVQGFFSSLPSKALYFRSNAFANKLTQKLRSTRYDLVIFDHAEMLWCLELVPAGVPTIAVAHNIESKIYAQYLESYPISRRVFGGDLRKYEAFEKERLGRVRKLIAISAVDAQELRATIPGVDILVVPPTFTYPPVQRSGKIRRPLRVGMLGNFGWWPNRDAYEWFFENVWQHVSGDCELHVFGANSESLRSNAKTTLHGYVNNIEDVWHGSDLMVNPIVSGSGVNVKVAEAIYNGMPMLCTLKAVSGLLTAPDGAIAVSDSPAEWIRILNGEEAVALAQRSLQATTRTRVSASAHVERMLAFARGEAAA